MHTLQDLAVCLSIKSLSVLEVRLPSPFANHAKCLSILGLDNIGLLQKIMLQPMIYRDSNGFISTVSGDSDSLRIILVLLQKKHQ